MPSLLCVQVIYYEGYMHEIFNEVGNDRVFGDLMEWINQRVR